MPLTFEWDRGKAARNERKHGVSFDEAITAFGDELSSTIADPAHSASERRYVLVGVAETGRLLVVVHAEEGDRIRVISARQATRRERRTYEQG